MGWAAREKLGDIAQGPACFFNDEMPVYDVARVEKIRREGLVSALGRVAVMSL